MIVEDWGQTPQDTCDRICLSDINATPEQARRLQSLLTNHGPGPKILSYGVAVSTDNKLTVRIEGGAKNTEMTAIRAILFTYLEMSGFSLHRVSDITYYQELRDM